ncbi:hypothetical protein BKI52_10695 [marine bacterium AO1-C]|nr:hypothetical protein BKI52_10695 [marine bacterium AO1-C]
MTRQGFRSKKMWFTFTICSALVTAILLVNWQAYSQRGKTKKARLVRQKRSNLKKLRSKIVNLKSVSAEKSNHIGQLKVIREQIKAQEKLVKELKSEIQLTEKDIDQIAVEIQATQTKLDTIKVAYGRMLHVYAKTSYRYNRLSMLFASNSINQLYQRIQYLKQYTRKRKQKAEKIRQLKARLVAQRDTLQLVKTEKEQLLTAKLSEGDTLRTLEKKERVFIKKLVAQERNLRKGIRYTRRNVSRLNRLIADVVRGRSRRGRRRRTGTVGKGGKGVSKVKLNKTGKKSAQGFARSKGRLPYPTQGVVVRKFGTYKHPLFKDVKIDSRGIDIQTKRSATVKAVYAGKVSTVATIPGMGGKVVMLQHGNYFTVYAKMKSVRVKPGNTVKAGQTLGRVYTAKDGTTQLQFQVWKDSQLLNPAHWLRR